jgi:hypothetical protein
MRRGVVHILSRMKQSSWQVLRVLVYMVSCIAKQETLWLRSFAGFGIALLLKVMAATGLASSRAARLSSPNLLPVHVHHSRVSSY